MSHSSAKNLLVINFFVFLFVFYPVPVGAAKYEFKFDFDARYGTHVYGAPSTATNRHSFAYEQKMEFDSSWSSVLGFRAEVESAYATFPERYGVGDVAKYDSQTFLLRDNYIQYQEGRFRARLGYQQVVWGEAFGYFYADIVNPKDYREAGLGSLSRNRLDIPIANLSWVFSSASIQTLLIPNPGYSLFPRPGSDFNTLNAPAELPGYSFALEREPINPLTRPEYGVRLTKQISALDFSAFYFNYYDRLPIYRYVINPLAQSISAKPDFKPLQTQGLTATADLDGYVLRFELLKHLDRENNFIEGNTLTSGKSNETVSVFGIDLQPINKWEISFQYSESLLEGTKPWVNRPRLEAIFNSRLSKTFNNNLVFEALFTEFTQDSGTLVQSQLVVPLSSQNEVLFGVDKFDGGDSTSLGRYKNASRAWIMFKGTFKR